MSGLQVVVADDDVLLREGLASLLTASGLEVLGQAGDAEELLALDRALHELARASPRQAMVVECRFFGGLEIPEAARLFEVSEATVLRDWRAARAWLAHRLRS